MRRSLTVIFLFLFCLAGHAQGSSLPSGLLMRLDGAIGPVTVDFVKRGIERAKTTKANIIVLEIDTPGGLDKSMRSIVTEILKSPIPIIGYVTPSGARAASAGTFILYASHLAAMAPGTNLGAATPVSLAGSEKAKAKTAEESKAENDASAYIRSLAQLRHRNVDWGEKAVLNAASLSASEALALKVIDIIAVDLRDLMTQANDRMVTIQNVNVQLHTKDLTFQRFIPDWRSRFLSIITDPNIAYILLLIGIYGLLFEFMNPGFILPGVVGGISLLIALYAFQLLPVNYVGLILIIMGIAFIIAEALVPSFGALGIGGAVAFIVGSIMLIDTKVGGFKLLLPIIIAVTLVSVAFLLLITQLALRAHRRPVVSGREELIGSVGIVLKKEGDEERNRIRIRGELWQVESEYPLKPGDYVKVVDISELILQVIPIEKPVKPESFIQGGKT